jgi:antitoxin YefM
MISSAKITGLAATVHLLRSPKNAERLVAALDRAQRKTLSPQSVAELRREVGLDELEALYAPDQEDDGERSRASPGAVE